MKRLILFISLLSCLQLAAQFDPITTDRPDQTESPAIVPAGYLQLEQGISFLSAADFTEYSILSTLVRYGINQYFECRLEIDPFLREDHLEKINELNAGVNPVAVGIKTKLLEGGSIIPQLSVITHLHLNKIATESEKVNYPAITTRLVASSQIAEQWSIGYNFGIEWDGMQLAPYYVYTLSNAFTLTGQLGFFAELFGNFYDNTGEHQVDGGFTYLLNQNIQFDISGGYNISLKQSFGGIGAAYRINCKNNNG